MENQNPFVWCEIYVDDLERATKFYETVFQTQLEDMSDPTDGGLKMRVFPGNAEVYGIHGALVKMEGAKVGTGGTIVYFGCQDCAVEESRIEAAGGKVCQKKMPIGEHGFCSIVTDTEGNTIGLHSMQ